MHVYRHTNSEKFNVKVKKSVLVEYCVYMCGVCVFFVCVCVCVCMCVVCVCTCDLLAAAGLESAIADSLEETEL